MVISPWRSMRPRPEVDQGKVKLEIRESPVHGRGVFAGGPIRAGATIAVLTGVPKLYSSFPRDLLLARGFEAEKDMYVVPEKGSPAWYLNHSEAPNCRYSIETRSVTASREISAGEELTIDYRDTTTWRGYASLWKEDVPP